MTAPSENANRLLVVVYDLADGRTDKPVPEHEIIAKARELAVFDMTRDQFATYHQATLDRVAALRRGAQ